MSEHIGIIEEVFIPSEDINDVMNSKKIGFKIKIDDEKIIQIIQDQDEFNSKLMKNDNVKITKQIINDKEFIDIELYEGETYE